MMHNFLDFINQAEGELLNNILPFWIKHTPDNEYGGFYGAITDDLIIDKHHPKSLVICCRILWTYSAAYSRYHSDSFRMMADRAYDYLINNFWDAEHGGLFWMLDYKGHPIDRRKQVYGIAFALYALSEFYSAFKIDDALTKAKELYYILERYAYEPEHGGYLESFTVDWNFDSSVKMLENDVYAPKTMNTQLHVLEAYTALARIWPSKDIRQSLTKLLLVMTEKVYNPSNKHLMLFFDLSWVQLSMRVSYGHDIESSWLICEAADVLNDHFILEKVHNISIELADGVYKDGLRPDGSVIYEEEQGIFSDTDRCWWVQAETVVGFLNAYQISSNTVYLDTSRRSWEYIQSHVVDKKHGEWFRRVDDAGQPKPGLLKVDEWKCPYHNSRACLEVINRLTQLRGKTRHEL